ncbi:hypothetical protein BASA83_011555 [Batrachochytrium salamandrivorans]|nr:hypothetical protein BASA83_011555 [Batrachochytrium salamandrivorans]
MTEPVAEAMETATAEKEATAATAVTGVKRGVQDMVADSSSHQANTYHHHYSSMTNGNTGTNDIHGYNHQQQGLHQSQQQQHNPEATIDPGYYADIVQQPVHVRYSKYYSNGIVLHPIEPCIAIQLHRKAQLDILGSSHNTIQNTSLLVARAYLTSSDGCSDMSYFVRPLNAEHTPHNQHSVPLSHKYKYPSSPFRRPAEPPSRPGSPIHPFGDASHPLQQSHISTSNRGSTHIPSPFPFPDITTLALLDFKTSHHPHFLSHEAPNSTDPADADHYPDSKRSVWTDITHHVLQLPLPSAPTASLFGSQTTAADIAMGEDGSRGVFFFFSDIGIRVSGQFKLCIVISRMPQE